MNHRERILALTVLVVAIVVGGGVVFKFLFLDSLNAINLQTADAEQDLKKKQAEEKKDADDRPPSRNATRDWASGSTSVCRRTKTRGRN